MDRRMGGEKRRQVSGWISPLIFRRSELRIDAGIGTVVMNCRPSQVAPASKGLSLSRSWWASGPTLAPASGKVKEHLAISPTRGTCRLTFPVESIIMASAPIWASLRALY